MWRRSQGHKGFTLIEVLVVLLSLVIILVGVGQLLFDTQKAAQRQQYQVDARQTARAAADYVTFLLRSATDMNMPTVTPPLPNNPGSIVVWYWVGTWAATNNIACTGPTASAGCVQATWDNVTDPSLADLGTDIITVGRVDNVQIYDQVGPGFSFNIAQTVHFYPALCAGTNGNSTNALAYFEQTTGYTSLTAPSPVMVIADTTGNWGYFQITSYPGQGADVCSPICNNTNGVGQPCVTVGTHIGVPGNTTINPPGNPNPIGDDDAVRLFAGVRFTSLRVCQGYLEQKDGMFDPGTDGSGTTFGGTGANACNSNGWNTAPWTPILPNVEDLQFAYIYNNDGTNANSQASIWNTSALGQTLPLTINYVPAQVGPGNAPPLLDVTNVVGVRVTVTGRAASSAPQETARFTMLPAENSPHAGAPMDKFYRFQASSIAMLRGRNPGS